MIEIKNLSKTYHNKANHFLALDDINLTLGDNGIVFIYGESGNGKSTLLNIISGLDSFESGEVLINGSSLKNFTPKQMDAYRRDYIGFVFEDYNLIEHLTVKENIKIAATLKDTISQDSEISTILKMLNMEGLEDRTPSEISGGQKQRVSIARMIFEKPKILFVDEPTGHLDFEKTSMIWDVLKELSKNCLIIAVSHEQRIVDTYADRVIELRSGKVLSDKSKVEKVSNGKNKSSGKMLTKMVDTKTIEENKQESTTQPINLELKGKLNASTIAKISISNLTAKKSKTILTILLSMLSLLFFSVFFLLNSFNINYTLAKNANEQNLSFIAFNNEHQINNTSLKQVYENTSNGNFFKLRQHSIEIGFGSDFLFSADKDYKINGLIEMSSALNNGYNMLGQKLLFGSYPTITNVNDIVISDYTAGLMMKYGVHVRDGNNIFLLKNKPVANILGKEIMFNGEYIAVCGIYETDYKTYVDNNLALNENANAKTFEYNLKNIYSFIHTNPLFIENKGLVNNEILSVSTEFKTNLTNASGGIEVNAFKNNYTLTSTINQLNIAGKTTLSNLEINLPYKLYNEMFNQNVKSDLSNLDLSQNSNNFVEVNVNNYEKIKYTVVGVNNTNNVVVFSEENYAKNITINNTVYDSVYKLSQFPSSKLLIETPNVEDLSKMITGLNSIGYTFESVGSQGIQDFSKKIEMFKNAFLGISIVSALFSAMILFTFLTQLMEDRRRDMGILVALGASKLDVAKIFMLTTSIIAIICFALSGLGAVTLSAIINVFNHGVLGFNMFSINVIMFIWLFVISVGVSALSCILPILKVVNKQPVDLIKK